MGKPFWRDQGFLILEYGCFQKKWYPQIINFNRVFPYKPSILGYHYFWKHPYILGKFPFPEGSICRRCEPMRLTEKGRCACTAGIYTQVSLHYVSLYANIYIYIYIFII